MRKLVALLCAIGLGAASCGDSSTTEAVASETGAGEAASEDFDTLDPNAVSDADTTGITITLITHDSFVVSDGIFDSFTESTGITVDPILGGDAGEMVSRAVLTAGAPEADVMFGIDNTFLQRGLDASIFTAYESPLLGSVPDDLELDDARRVTPIDFGDVCLNNTVDGVDGEVPTSIADLTDPTFASAFVTPNPESSSPGFAFLLATIATFGEDGWEDYWTELADGGVTVTSGWNDAYYGEFVSGGGDKTIVTSYATSPVAEVLFADPPVDSAPTSVIVDSCFRQVEFAGILAGTEHPEAAAKLIDFMLSPTFQADIPLNMFVAPANESVPLPDAFIEHGIVVSDPLTLSPEEIEENRAAWTERWTEIVLR